MLRVISIQTYIINKLLQNAFYKFIILSNHFVTCVATYLTSTIINNKCLVLRSCVQKRGCKNLKKEALIKMKTF